MLPLRRPQKYSNSSLPPERRDHLIVLLLKRQLCAAGLPASRTRQISIAGEHTRWQRRPAARKAIDAAQRSREGDGAVSCRSGGLSVDEEDADPHEIAEERFELPAITVVQAAGKRLEGRLAFA